MIEKLAMFLKIGFVNTIRMNLYYFGVGAILHPIIICSRNLKIVKLEGRVIALQKKIGTIKIGFSSAGIVDGKYSRSLWENRGTIVFQGSALIGTAVKIANSGTLTLGDNLFLNCNSMLICKKKK